MDAGSALTAWAAVGLVALAACASYALIAGHEKHVPVRTARNRAAIARQSQQN